MRAVTEYETDFNAWVTSQLDFLKKKQFEKLDLDNLIEEFDSLGKKDRHSLESHLVIILQHLLKITYTPDLKGNSNSWDMSIFNSRRNIFKLIKNSPSLKRFIPEMIPEAYKDARQFAIIETNSIHTKEYLFPEECPWTQHEIIAPYPSEEKYW